MEPENIKSRLRTNSGNAKNLMDSRLDGTGDSAAITPQLKTQDVISGPEVEISEHHSEQTIPLAQLEKVFKNLIDGAQNKILGLSQSIMEDLTELNAKQHDNM